MRKSMSHTRAKKKYEFNSWAEFEDFASEHPEEFEKGDEIVVNQPIFEKCAAPESKLKFVFKYNKEKEK